MKNIKIVLKSGYVLDGNLSFDEESDYDEWSQIIKNAIKNGAKGTVEIDCWKVISVNEIAAISLS